MSKLLSLYRSATQEYPQFLSEITRKEQRFARLFYPVIIIGLMYGQASSAAHNQPVYTKAPGQPMDATRAILDAAAGEKVYKCELVEAKISKSGTSVSLRKRKKQITAEDAAQKIEEIKNQVGK